MDAETRAVDELAQEVGLAAAALSWASEVDGPPCMSKRSKLVRLGLRAELLSVDACASAAV